MLDQFLEQRAVRAMVVAGSLCILIAALHAAASIIAPMVLGLVFGIVVAPLYDRMSRLGLPKVVSASAMLLLTTAVCFLLFLILEPLVSTMVERLPRLQVAIERWMASVSDFLRGIETISEEIEETVGAKAKEDGNAIPSVKDALWLAPSMVSQFFVFIGTFFFFVLTREDIYNAVSGLSYRLYRAEAMVSRYFAAITIVNAGVGAVMAVALMALGLDYALLWGLAAGLLNFILYLGPLVLIGGLLVAGLVQFWDAYAFLPPAAFVLINIVESQFVTPIFVGQHVALNPLVVFLAIIFGLWIWGAIGAIVVLPVILWLGIMLRPEDYYSDAQELTGFSI